MFKEKILVLRIRFQGHLGETAIPEIVGKRLADYRFPCAVFLFRIDVQVLKTQILAERKREDGKGNLPAGQLRPDFRAQDAGGRSGGEDLDVFRLAAPPDPLFPSRDILDLIEEQIAAVGRVDRFAIGPVEPFQQVDGIIRREKRLVQIDPKNG